MTQVWFRNPHNWVRELQELGVGEIVFDRGLLVSRRIDIAKWSAGFLSGINYRILCVGEQGTAEVTPETTLESPKAVYPTWQYGVDSFPILEELCANNVGEDQVACDDTSVPDDERPVYGQEHRVVIIRPPNAASSAGRSFFRDLKDLQEEYPECIIHVHGLYSYRTAFGMGYGAADMECRSLAAQSKVMLPNGKQIHKDRLSEHQQWIHLLGFSLPQLEKPRERCMYNIKSAIWAGAHFHENTRFNTAPSHPVSASSPNPGTSLAPTSSPYRGVAESGDKINCDTCSLQTTCKFYRDGAVCSLPGSEPATLASQFKTRDSNIIIEGLGTLMASQSRRFERATELELELDEMDPEVTKIFNSLMTHGVKLAKLIDPALNSPKLAMYFQNGAPGAPGTSGPPVNPKVVIGRAMAALEQQGIPRSQQTPEMIANVLNQPSLVAQSQVIESTAIAHRNEEQSA